MLIEVTFNCRCRRCCRRRRRGGGYFLLPAHNSLFPSYLLVSNFKAHLSSSIGKQCPEDVASCGLSTLTVVYTEDAADVLPHSRCSLQNSSPLMFGAPPVGTRLMLISLSLFTDMR